MAEHAARKDEEGAQGTVRIFNTTNLRITVTLNGNALHKIDPAQPDGMPSILDVPRSDASSIDDPVFATTNNVMVMFAGSRNTYGTVTIDPVQYSTNKDLAFYIFYNLAILVDLSTNMLVGGSALTPDKAS